MWCKDSQPVMAGCPCKLLRQIRVQDTSNRLVGAFKFLGNNTAEVAKDLWAQLCNVFPQRTPMVLRGCPVCRAGYWLQDGIPPRSEHTLSMIAFSAFIAWPRSSSPAMPLRF